MNKPGNLPCSSVPRSALTDLSVTFENSVKEHARAGRSLMFRQPAFRIYFAFLLGGPLTVLVYTNLREQRPDPDVWWLVAGLLLLGGLVLYMFPRLQVLSLRKGQAGIGGPHTMTFTDAGVAVRSPHTNVDLTWEAIYAVRETREFIFIHIGKNVAYFLPKRVLTPETLSQARALLWSYLGDRARVSAA